MVARGGAVGWGTALQAEIVYKGGMLHCYVLLLRLKTDIKIDVCLFKNYIS